MAIPSTQKQWIISGTEKGFDEWKLVDGPVPKVTSRGVLVKLHATSINGRELLIPNGRFPYELKLPIVGGSDGAGEVLEVGNEVTKWMKGDRVTTLFNPGHQSGALWGDAYRMGSLGCTIDGTFQQYAIYDEDWLVRLASNLSYVEGASLSNAAVTAWNALYGLKPLKPGEWVLVQGTGGVSMFATQFAKAGGATVVATTSSSTKAEALRRIGADHIINYNDNPEWGEEAKRLSGRNEGIDNVIEIGGPATMKQSIAAVKKEGVITLIGLVTGVDAPINALEAIAKIFTLRGIHVGPKVQFEDMMAAMEANKIQPVIDEKEFQLDDLVEALKYLKSQKHVGKVVLKIA